MRAENVANHIITSVSLWGRDAGNRLKVPWLSTLHERNGDWPSILLREKFTNKFPLSTLYCLAFEGIVADADILRVYQARN
jgi:hypothetical protein